MAVFAKALAFVFSYKGWFVVCPCPAAAFKFPKKVPSLCCGADCKKSKRDLLASICLCACCCLSNPTAANCA